jgi:hypothetical protein
VQKAHFKTGNIPRLEAAIKVYSGLLDNKVMESEVATKLINMLLHPYPRVSASPLVPQPLLMIVGSHCRGGAFIHAF